MLIHFLESVLLLLDDGAVENLLVGEALLLLRNPLVDLGDHLLQLLVLFSRHEGRLTRVLQTDVLTGLLTQDQLAKLRGQGSLPRDRFEHVALRLARTECGPVVAVRSLVLACPQDELRKLLRLQIVVGPALGVGVERVNS